MTPELLDLARELGVYIVSKKEADEFEGRVVALLRPTLTYLALADGDPRIADAYAEMRDARQSLFLSDER